MTQQDMQQRPSIRETLDRRADEMAATTHAIVEGRKAMSLIDKMNQLSQRRKELNEHMEGRADELLLRYNAMPARIDGAFDKHLAQLDAEEKQLKEMNDAIDRVTNMGNSDQSTSGTGA